MRKAGFSWGLFCDPPFPPQAFPRKMIERGVVLVAVATWGHQSVWPLEVGTEGIGISVGETGSDTV